ncbi:MAG: ATP-dependent zinc metalloprotease FtsH [Candidatus Omnitrophota bacterium]
METKRKPTPPGQQPQMPPIWKSLFFWAILGILIFQITRASSLLEKKPAEKISYSDFLNYIGTGQVSGKITIRQGQVSGKTADGKEFKTFVPDNDPEFYQILRNQKVSFEVLPEAGRAVWVQILAAALPILIIIGFFWFMVYRRSGGGDQILSFGRIRPQPLSETKPKTTFNDVAGYQEAKEELQEVIEFLKDPKKFQTLGGRIPKGVLVIGPPGTGKTLLAKAVAGEANVSFLSMSGSEFVEMFVGVGASRVRDLFRQAKKMAPSIIFIDEIDAVGRQRFAGLGGGHDEREQTLNQLLVEMDGFNTEEGIILMAATNRPDVLDPALVRPGRFDRQIMLHLPDVQERDAILRVHTKKSKLGGDVDLSVIAKSTPGMSGADLANLCNEAALLASRKNHQAIEMTDLDEAMDKEMMGAQRKSMVLNQEEKKVIAYHESGHVLVQRSLPESQPIHKVTIIPRGRSLGATHILPERDIHIENETFFRNSLITLLGGRAAEKIIFQKMYTGAENDLQSATELTRQMVCEWGMSSRLGPVSYHNRSLGEVFLGRDLARTREYSETTAREIDEEIKTILENSEKEALRLLQENRAKLEKLANTLLEKETLTGKEVDELLKEETR